MFCGCSGCGHVLTNEHSRLIGKGPTCAAGRCIHKASTESHSSSSLAESAVSAGIEAVDMITEIEPTAKIIKFGYKGAQEVHSTITDSRKVWRSKASTSTRVTKIANRIGEAAGNISKQAAAEMMAGIPSYMASTVVNVVDSYGAFSQIEDATGIPGIGDVAKNMLSNVVESEIQRRFAS